MTNEELVAEIRAGRCDLFDRLWTQNTGLAARIARRYNPYPLDFEDLMRVAFIGLVAAVEGFWPEEGTMFTTYAGHVKRTAMRRTLGLDGRVRADHGAVSLDEPIGDDATRLDALADDSFPDLADHAAPEDARQRVRATVDALPADQAAVIRGQYLEGLTLPQVAQREGVPLSVVASCRDKAMRTLQHDWRLRRLLDERAAHHRHKGIEAFRSTWSSVVEDAVMWREACATGQHVVY